MLQIKRHMANYTWTYSCDNPLDDIDKLMSDNKTVELIEDVIGDFYEDMDNVKTIVSNKYILYTALCKYFSDRNWFNDHEIKKKVRNIVNTYGMDHEMLEMFRFATGGDRTIEQFNQWMNN